MSVANVEPHTFELRMGAWNLILLIHVEVNRQLWKQGFYPTLWRVQLPTRRGYVFFFKLASDKLLVFNWLQGQLEVDFFAMVKNKIFSLLFEANFWGSFALAKSIYYPGIWNLVYFKYHYDRIKLLFLLTVYEWFRGNEPVY